MSNILQQNAAEWAGFVISSLAHPGPGAWKKSGIRGVLV